MVPAPSTALSGCADKKAGLRCYQTAPAPLPPGFPIMLGCSTKEDSISLRNVNEEVPPIALFRLAGTFDYKGWRLSI